MIENEDQARSKACQLLGSPHYFRAMLVKNQPAIDKVPPQWIVSADIGRHKKAANVCIMFPQDMEPVPARPADGTFEAKLWDLRHECREMVELLDLALPQPPNSGHWWEWVDKRAESLKQALQRTWEDKFK